MPSLMSTLLSSLLFLGLALTEAHEVTSCVAGQAGAPTPLLVQEGFLGEAEVDSIRSSLPIQTFGDAFYASVEVPSGVLDRLRATLAPAHNFTAVHQSQLPVKRTYKSIDNHKDQVVGLGGLAEGMVGVLYLSGDGDMVVTEDRTGVESSVPVAPGKLVAWNNQEYTHRLDAGTPGVPREMLGPIALHGLSGLFKGVGGGGSPAQYIFQAWATSQTVKPGRTVTLKGAITFLSFGTETNTQLTLSLVNVPAVFRSATLKPNVKPAISSVEVNTGTRGFTLPHSRLQTRVSYTATFVYTVPADTAVGTQMLFVLDAFATGSWSSGTQVSVIVV